MKRRWLGLLGATALLLAGGCATSVARPDNAIPERDAALAAWGRVLVKHVDDQGRLNFRGVAQDRGDLDTYVRYVASTSPWRAPNEFPTLPDKLAYSLNSYNALALYNLIDYGIPENLSGFTTLKFFVLRSLSVGRDFISLYDYENHKIRAYGEERVHFALNCMVRGCPRLPREPFTPEKLEAQLEREARHFLNEDRNIRIDIAARVVHVSSILKFYTEDFLKKAPNLTAYINRYRALGARVPEDFRVEFIPYDWTVNSQPK